MSQQAPIAVLLLLAQVGPGRGWSTSETHSNASVRSASSEYRASYRTPASGAAQHRHTAPQQDLPTYPLPPPMPRLAPASARSTPAAADAVAAEPLAMPVMQADASASSSTYLHRSLSGTRPISHLDSLTGTPSSFSYFMQVQPHPRGSSYRGRTRQTTRVVNLVPHGSSGGAREQSPRAQENIVQRTPFSGPTFQSFPFGPIKVPSSFTHPNPLASHYRRPPAPAAASEDYVGDAPPAGFAEAGSYFDGRPLDSAAALGPTRGRARQRRPKSKMKPMEITVLGDPQRPNLGIVGVPGHDVYNPPPPRIREYDPYTGRFKVLTPAEAHDSREAYRRPGASAEHASAEDADEHHPDEGEGRDELREDESYEVYETPDETHSLVPMRAPRGRASGCLQKDFLTGLLSPLLNAVRPAIKQCQKQQKQKQALQQHQQHPQHQQQFGRLHRPRGRPRKKQAKQRNKQQQRLRQLREPYFEFRNPVHNYISGEPSPQPQGRGFDDLTDGDADAEYLSIGDAEHESRAEHPELQQQLFTEGETDDDGVFAPYSVYRTVLEPDRKLRPFVRFPFEAERSDLKAMVSDLIHQGTAPP